MAHARHIPTLNLTILGHAQPYCQPSAYCSSRGTNPNSNRGRATETKFRFSATAVSVGASTRQSPARPRQVAVRQVIDPEEWTNLFGRVKRHESICLGLTQCADLHVLFGQASKTRSVAGLMLASTLEGYNTPWSPPASEPAARLIDTPSTLPTNILYQPSTFPRCLLLTCDLLAI